MPKTSSYHDALIKALADPVEARHYLRAVIDDNPQGFLKALRNVAQANKMKNVAEAAGIKRESLYRALSEQGNPTLETLSSVLGALGMRLSVEMNAPPRKKSARSAVKVASARTAARRELVKVNGE